MSAGSVVIVLLAVALLAAAVVLVRSRQPEPLVAHRRGHAGVGGVLHGRGRIR